MESSLKTFLESLKPGKIYINPSSSNKAPMMFVNHFWIGSTMLHVTFLHGKEHFRYIFYEDLPACYVNRFKEME